MKNLLWLASYPKSGNTWVRAMLTAYLTRWTRPFALEAMDEFTASDSVYRDYLALAGRSTGQLTEDQIDALRMEVQLTLTQRKQRPFWIKTHNANITRRGHRLICPEFTWAAVYIVRNPLDVVESLAHHTNVSIDGAIALMKAKQHCLVAADSRLVHQYLGSWSQHVRSWFYETRFPVLVVRYEDLQTRGRETL